MPRYAYDRLSAQDLSFLLAENEHSPMHVGGIAILEAEPLRNEQGAVDIARYRRYVESRLHWIPRYRQKLDWIPFEDWPVWVDDRHFDLGYHIRHISLPRPGTIEQLHELAARIMARHLDRERALWEIWVIEGLHDGEQVAMLNKIHHCMIDGAAGADLSQILLSPSPNADELEPLPYYPRPAPTRLELLEEAVRDRFGAGWRAVRSAAAWWNDGESSAVELLERAAGAVRERTDALTEMAGLLLRPASETPINGEPSPHRRIDWLTMPLDDVRELRSELGCTVNDVVLTIVTGALRRYLFRRRVDPAKLDFRIAAPVNVRRDEHANQLGNHVSSWVLRAPLECADPIDQIGAVRERTAELKRSKASLAFETVMAAAEYLPPGLIRRGVAFANAPANMIVTNVPGPQFPLYTLGARLLGLYPIVPLLPGGGLTVALFGYEGKLCWGFNADYELVPNLDEFVDDVRWSFEQLRAAVVSEFLERRTGVEAEPDGEPGLAESDTESMAASSAEPAEPAEAASEAADVARADPRELRVVDPEPAEEAGDRLEADASFESDGLRTEAGLHAFAD